MTDVDPQIFHARDLENAMREEAMMREDDAIRQSDEIAHCTIPMDNNPKARLGALKAPLHQIPTTGLPAVARVLAHGAEKYGFMNWRAESISITTYQAAILRHLFAWYEGEDHDLDSGEHHMAHIAANALMLLDARRHGQLIDDRPRGEIRGSS